MALIVKFIATRPDTSAPFFYDVPEFAEQIELADLIKEEMSTIEGAIESYSRTYSEDQLTCTIEIIFGNHQYYNQYISNLNIRIPRGVIDRNNYFLTHKHTLVTHWKNSAGDIEGSIIQVA